MLHSRNRVTSFEDQRGCATSREDYTVFFSSSYAISPARAPISLASSRALESICSRILALVTFPADGAIRIPTAYPSPSPIKNRTANSF
jgi:hypothetical protein